MSSVKPIHIEFKETFRLIAVAVEAASLGKVLPRDISRRPISSTRLDFQIEDLGDTERDAGFLQKGMETLLTSLQERLSEAAGGDFLQEYPLEVPKFYDITRMRIGRLTVYCDRNMLGMLPHGAKFIIPVERVKVDLYGAQA